MKSRSFVFSSSIFYYLLFLQGADGKLRLRAGKKKIDINKLTKEDLKALGIDPNMSKQEIARALKEKFGDDIRIMKGGQKVSLMVYCKR